MTIYTKNNPIAGYSGTWEREKSTNKYYQNYIDQFHYEGNVTQKTT